MQWAVKICVIILLFQINLFFIGEMVKNKQKIEKVSSTCRLVGIAFDPTKNKLLTHKSGCINFVL